MKELLDRILKEIGRNYAQAFEAEMHRIFGPSPDLEEVQRRGMLFKCQDEDGFYDELRVDGIPRFQQRLKFKDSQALIEIKRC